MLASRASPSSWAWGPQMLSHFSHEYPKTPQKAGEDSKRDLDSVESPQKSFAPIMRGQRSQGGTWTVATPQARPSKSTTAGSAPRLQPRDIPADIHQPIDVYAGVARQDRFGALADFSVNGPFLGATGAEASLLELPPLIRSALSFLRNVQSFPHTSCGPGRGFLPSMSNWPPRPTLVLDLDETLAHCCRDLSKRPVGCGAADLTVHFEEAPHIGHVYFRPFAKLFLEVMSGKFEITVFTASQRAYADKVLDAMDPGRELITHRLYRQHCTEHRGAFFKELGLLGRPVSQCILVDNSPISVACNANNSILIRSWYGEPADRELVELMQILEQALNYADFGRYLESRYGLREFFSALQANHQNGW